MADRTVLITGTSTGIGRATAAELAARGFRVLAGVRREEDAEAVRALDPARIEPLMLDVTDFDAIASLPDRVDGDLAGVVNNAGMALPGPLEYLPLEDVRRQLDVMLVAPFALTKAFIPALRRSRGRLVIIGSIGGRMAGPFISPYNAAKFGVEGLADSLRRELTPSGIEVSLVEPGSVKTEIWEKGIRAGNELFDSLPEEGRRLYGDRIRATEKVATDAVRRGVKPEKVARAVLHALTADRPRTRYLVGIDARVQATLAAVLPDRMLDRTMSRLTGVR
ncbi:MAG TPA: SDR family oxidoreductase [Thermoleophilaceae bacterium]